MIKLDQKYARQDFIDFLQNTFLQDYVRDIRSVSTHGLHAIKKATSLGRSDSLDLQVFEFEYTGSANKRVALTKEAFQIMKQSSTFNALAVFYGQDSDDWRLSFLTANPERTEKGKVILAYSNPRRYSFFLGSDAKINTPTKFLISKGKITNFEDLKSRFSIEVVNKEFYKEISKAFTQLSNGLLKLPFVQEKSQTNSEFAVRLIGRIIFCWFLREKKSEIGSALMPKELLSLDAVSQNEDYYHKILEPIFFEVLNKPVKTRKDDFAKEPFASVPYLNGGLFSPQDDDFYKRSNGDFQSQFHNTLVVPDSWFKEFFETLETYNFTIDENTSFDEELSIDPEMLGRIFENLLAEINPETGESARKATGSYYTPRTIVSYMVDESLLLYLKQQTSIDEGKLRAIISYDLTDDSEYPISQEEKEKIIDALENLKLLDPACGSGAFPIGALQKIVFVLQQIDPDGQLWFRKQLIRTSPELRRVIEREFENQNFDYIRKLGIIRENIYGIDIQPIATEISRLRCFLTLIVDERVQDELENRGIEPLPNLDFKFVTANSLIGLPTSQNINQMGLFEDDEGIKQLKELRDMFFTATGVEREQLKLQFVQAQNRMFQRMIEGGTKGYADLTTRLSGWDPFSHKASTWFDTEWMYGLKDGFNVIITNPPYITIRNQTIEIRDYIRSNFKLSGGADLYVAFIEKSFSLLFPDGVAVFICPNKFFGADYGKKIRAELNAGTTKIFSIWDLKDVRVFDALISTVVIIFRKNYTDDLVFVKNNIGVSKLNVFDQRNKIQIEQNDDDKKIITKLELFKTLSNFSKIRTGIMGFEYWKMEPIIKESGDGVPLLTNGNIEQYFDLWGKKKIDLYKKHFLNPKIELNQKYLNENTIKLFKQKNKIVVRGVAKRLTACLDLRESGVLVAVHTVLSNDNKLNYYLLGLINSNLLNWFHLHTYYSVRIPQGSLKYPVDCISTLPIPDPESNKDLFFKITDIVKEIYKSRSITDDVKNDIDQAVYELYGLTEEEKRIVEGKNNE